MNQVSATVNARFSSKNMPPGKTVYGVFTRDYRSDVMNCQVGEVKGLIRFLVGSVKLKPPFNVQRPEDDFFKIIII